MNIHSSLTCSCTRLLILMTKIQNSQFRIRYTFHMTLTTGRKGKWTTAWMIQIMNKLLNGWMSYCMNYLLNEWMNEWMKEWIN